jgi:hypothetical protein
MKIDNTVMKFNLIVHACKRPKKHYTNKIMIKMNIDVEITKNSTIYHKNL